jgi:predicted secreted protein
MTRYAAWATLAAAVVASVALAVLPTGESTSASSSVASDGTVTSAPTTIERTTLLETEGRSVLIVLAIPVLLAAGALIRRRWARLSAAVLLTAFCLLGAASIGFAYLPAVVLAWVAARPENPGRHKRLVDQVADL